MISGFSFPLFNLGFAFGESILKLSLGKCYPLFIQIIIIIFIWIGWHGVI
ncbi:hypothetical protein GWL_38160 [Herbaspirillum sp. GW103]|nr:hypothetical protein GWL_38160 [Herbaspirillum sp. GW103]